MRVALVSEHASPLAALGGVDAGGQNVHVAELALGLGRRGHTVVVYSRRDDPDLPAEVPMSWGVTVHHVDAGPARPIPKDELAPHMPAFARELRRALATAGSDVVHTHFWMSGRAGLAAAAPLEIPVAHTYHALGTVKRRHQGLGDTSPRERCTVELEIACRADRVLATCSDELRELVAMGAPTAHVRIVPCGVDVRRFSPIGRPRPRHGGLPYRVLALGRLVPRKGVDDAIRAIRDVPDAELVIAGGPPYDQLESDPEASRLLDIAAALGVSPRVRLLGAVARDEVPRLLRSADVVVCAPWYEPFGIVPLEAMACGVPVVATAVGGMLDTIDDGVTGSLVPPRNPPALTRAIRALLDDADRRREMGRAGIRRVRSRYTWDVVAARTAATYEEVTGAIRSIPAVGQ